MAGSSACESSSIPMTVSQARPRRSQSKKPGPRTRVNKLELADDVEADVGKVVLEQLKKEREEVFDRRLLAQERREARDLGAEGGADVLRGVGRELADAGHDARQDDFAVDELGETCANGRA
jgi:hypothetical protein